MKRPRHFKIGEIIIGYTDAGEFRCSAGERRVETCSWVFDDPAQLRSFLAWLARATDWMTEGGVESPPMAAKEGSR